MRILQAIDCYPPPLVGGHALQVQMLSQELATRGHDVEVLSLAGPQNSRLEFDGEVPIHRIEGWSRLLRRVSADPNRSLHPTIADPGIMRTVSTILRNGPPDIVHAHGWILHSLLPLLPTSKTRLVVTMHEYGMVCAKNSYVHKGQDCTGPRLGKCISCAADQYGTFQSIALTTGLAITERSKLRVDKFLAVSTPVARACASLEAGGSRNIQVIPPFVPDDAFTIDHDGRPSFVPRTDDYIMFAGALAPHKGVDVLVEAWKGLASPIPLVLAGIRQHDTPKTMPEGVIVAENVPHDDVIRAWKHCAFAVVPSRWPDPSPLVALEAMAAGRPVIASAVGGLPDIVQDGVTGILLPPGDVRALRTTMENLIADPERRVRMGEASRLRAVMYSARTVLPQLERVYEDVIASPPPASEPRGLNVFR